MIDFALTAFLIGGTSLLKFYDIDKDYVDYLQSEERKVRGFTRVPNMRYDTNREQKFLCGIVLEINQMAYYVPVTSYKKKQNDNIIIEIPEDKNPIKGSLRFNYMIPVPKQFVSLKNFNKEKPQQVLLIKKEYNFVRKNEDKILKKALSTYNKVIKGKNHFLIKNSCDFKLLEEKCREYIRTQSKENAEINSSSLASSAAPSDDENFKKLKSHFCDAMNINENNLSSAELTDRLNKIIDVIASYENEEEKNCEIEDENIE